MLPPPQPPTVARSLCLRQPALPPYSCRWCHGQSFWQSCCPGCLRVTALRVGVLLCVWAACSAVRERGGCWEWQPLLLLLLLLPLLAE